ncbi:hypothetical protein [Streptomyces sp. A1136]|uniref:hypothetical protein n=1 Tax=Streptomyces sp. A1136 TaxID=2563102 RepID=UPI00109EB60F|nr:hypothetical protein [Streptomyces sp. A1136]THA47485.1 hypothetical protein E6R62_31230 [Streptomyces sp. A1136]
MEQLLWWMPLWMADYWVELTGNWKLTRAIDQALAAQDAEALAVFKTGTLRATFTEKGMVARTDELVAYAELVVAVDGCAYRYHRLFSHLELSA